MKTGSRYQQESLTEDIRIIGPFLREVKSKLETTLSTHKEMHFWVEEL